MQPPQPWLDCAGRQSVRQLSAVPLPTKNPEAPWNKDDRSALVTQPSIWFGGSLWACTAPEAIARNAIEAIVRVLFVIDFLRESLIYQSHRSLAAAACCRPERRSAERKSVTSGTPGSGPLRHTRRNASRPAGPLRPLRSRTPGRSPRRSG